MTQRAALHDAYLSVAGGVDASRLAYLGTQRRIFTDAEVAALWARQAERAYAQPPANHVYVHVPFCKSICSFCNYERLKAGNTENMSRWLTRVVASAEALAPSLAGLQFHNLYLGGGTPSMLTAEMLESLFSALDRLFPFHANAVRSFEFDPAAMSTAKVDVLRRFGFSNFSFGVQTLSPDVNADHHRGHQDRDLVQRRLDELSPFATSVNCDFLLGLAGTEPDAIYQEIEDVLRMPVPPRNIDIFVMVPSPAYVASHFGGDLEAFEAHVERFRQSAPARLAAIAAATGYDLEGTSSHCFRMTHPAQGQGTRTGGPSGAAKLHGYTQYTHLQGAPLNLLGLGTSARSHLFGTAQFDYEDPNGDVTCEGPGHFIGRTMTLGEEARVFVIMRLRDKYALDFTEFESIFGTSLDTLLPDVVGALVAEGIVMRERCGLRMVRPDGATMLRDLLWVVGSEALEREVARYLGVLLSAGELAELTQVPDGTVLDGLRVRHDEGATWLEGSSGGLRVRWAPTVAGDRVTLEARVESSLRSSPTAAMRGVVRAMERRIGRALERRRARRKHPLQVVPA